MSIRDLLDFGGSIREGLEDLNLKFHQIDNNTLSLENLADGTYKNFKLGVLTTVTPMILTPDATDYYWFGIGGTTVDKLAVAFFDQVITPTEPRRIVLKARDATAAKTTYNTEICWENKYWDGASSKNWTFLIYHEITATTPTSYASFEFGELGGACATKFALFHDGRIQVYNPTFTRNVNDSYLDIGAGVTGGATFRGYGGDHTTQPGFSKIRFGDIRAGKTPASTVQFNYMANAGETTVATLDRFGVLSTITGITPAASSKINPASGVAGFSVVSTALTLGTSGAIVAPIVAGANTDATSGNLDGCHGVDTTGAAERWYFRAGATWRYISKTGGLSMTKEERIDPTGHEFQIGDTVKLVVDKILPDGSFHALPYYVGES